MSSGVLPAHAQDGAAAGDGAPAEAAPAELSAAQLFAFADQARDAGDYRTAEAAYRALSGNPDIELRSEARFRLALMLADREQKYREAAIELRRILDERPGAARVRLELARMHAMLGDIGAAGRELRAADAAGLPPEVERMVRFYANALSARQPIGGSLEIAIAPDSNINRATKSGTLGTIFGDFNLNDDARERSGVGLSLRGQAYWRTALDHRSKLLTRISGDADIYRASRFSDYILSIQTGPEYNAGSDRIAVSIGPSWRWYGGEPYSRSIGGSADWRHPMGSRTLLRAGGGISYVDNRRNDLQDAGQYYLSLGLDRAVSARFGGGVQASFVRESARDPGYSTTSGGATVYLFREMGRITATLTAGYSRLEADDRLFIYRFRRQDDRFSASFSCTFRRFRIASLAPLVRLRWERNRSTVELYDYHRTAAEIGLTAAF